MDIEPILKEYQARITRLHAEIDALRAELSTLKRALLSMEHPEGMTDELRLLLVRLGDSLDEIGKRETPTGT